LPLSQTLSSTTPYPTASAVNVNAVAFIERDNENNLSLWVANVDGSGERKLVENIGKWSDATNYFLRWSPSGKWISYISNDEMWIISSDGLEQKKVLPASDQNKRLMSYNWAPDDSQIAYSQASLYDSKFDSVSIRILDLKTGETYEISSQKPQPYGSIIRWSPDGQLLAFNKNASFIIFDIVNQKVKQEILTDDLYMCSGLNNTAPVWSPNSKEFFHFQSSGSAAVFWTCMSNLDGANYRIDTNGSTSEPVWDKTGKFLYFVLTKGDIQGGLDMELQRYDVETKEQEFLLSLGKRHRSGWSVSISPDGKVLDVHTDISEKEGSYIFMDLKSLSVTAKSTFGLNCIWSNNSENFICMSQSNGYSTFHRLNVQTGTDSTFSGEHVIVSWVTSPVATTP